MSSEVITAIATSLGTLILGIDFWIKLTTPPIYLSLTAKSYYHKDGTDFAEIELELRSSKRIRVHSISSSNKKLSFFCDKSYENKLSLGYCPDENSGGIPLFLYVKPYPSTGDAIKLTLDIGRHKFFNPVYKFYPNDFFDTKIPDQGIWPSSPKS